MCVDMHCCFLFDILVMFLNDLAVVFCRCANDVMVMRWLCPRRYKCWLGFRYILVR